MILAIDVGNTNIVLGCIADGGISRVFRMSTDTAKTEDEYAADIDAIFSFNRILRTAFKGAVMSCVVTPLTGVIKAAIRLLTGLDAIVVGAGIKTGMNILIDDPGQLAGDMASTAVAALASYSPPVIIVDMGTATKITVLSDKGSYIGGAILPGVTLSVNALSAGTSQLPRIPIEAPPRCISTNTVDAMKSGAIFGAAAVIDGMAERFEAELGMNAVIVATGGFAARVVPYCRREIIHDPHLLLRGLGIIYEKNKRK